MFFMYAKRSVPWIVIHMATSDIRQQKLEIIESSRQQERSKCLLIAFHSISQAVISEYCSFSKLSCESCQNGRHNEPMPVLPGNELNQSSPKLKTMVVKTINRHHFICLFYQACAISAWHCLFLETSLPMQRSHDTLASGIWAKNWCAKRNRYNWLHGAQLGWTHRSNFALGHSVLMATSPFGHSAMRNNFAIWPLCPQELHHHASR